MYWSSSSSFGLSRVPEARKTIILRAEIGYRLSILLSESVASRATAVAPAGHADETCCRDCSTRIAEQEWATLLLESPSEGGNLVTKEGMDALWDLHDIAMAIEVTAWWSWSSLVLLSLLLFPSLSVSPFGGVFVLFP